MNPTDRHLSLPNPDRLSLVSATILLAYAVARFIQLPAFNLATQLPGFYLSIEINVQMVVALIVAGLTAAGADWLLRDHPALKGKPAPEHWLLPALTAWAIGLPLFQTPIGPRWWIGFALGGALLILTLVAEYIVADPQDERRGPASAGLVALAFALFLVLAAGLRFSGLRLFLRLPALGLAGGLVSLRALRLRLPGGWAVAPAGLVALVIGQMAAALHYWPIPPVPFGLALLGPAYALNTLVGNLAEGEPPRQAALEPLIVLLIIWGTALWMR